MTDARVVQWDIHATDALAQRHFYSDIFGWACSHPEDAAQYGWMSTPDGRMFGGIGQASAGDTPGVTIFIQVSDVPATIEQAETLGGSVLWGPMEQPDGMVTAGIADPHGNALLLIRPSDTGEPYASRPPIDPGQWEWEIQSPDPAALASFYEALFGWSFDGLNDWGWGQVLTGPDGGPDGALAAGDAPCTFFYTTVTDIHAAVARVEAFGGRIAVDPWQVSDELAIAICTDPEGNRHGLRCLTAATATSLRE